MSDLIILNICGLSKTYRSEKGIETKVLDKFNLQVRKGEMTAVMGSSGSGKTTLINILTGLIPADAGRVIVDGADLSELTEDEMAVYRRKKIGIVFQNFNLIDSLTVEENIRVPLILDGVLEKQEEIAKQSASLLGITEVLEKFPEEISGGQKQRAGICRALVNEPAIIYADEPTGNLDAAATRQVMDYFIKACRERKTSLLMVTHDPRAASCCDRIVFLRDGRLACEIKKDMKDQKTFYKAILEAQKEGLTGWN